MQPRKRRPRPGPRASCCARHGWRRLPRNRSGWPFAGLVTPATDGALSVLLLLSDLSEHTKQLRRDSRCAVLVTGEPAGPNPQTTPRVTVSGRAEIVEHDCMRERYLAVHPYAALYAGFGDFRLWRVVPEDAMLVAGFARAHRLPGGELRPPPGAVAAIEAAASGIMAHCNTAHPDTLALLAGRPGTWRMAGVDADGCDLAERDGTTVRRVSWPVPVSDADGVRRALILLAREARSR